jgi:hypothetical protein
MSEFRIPEHVHASDAPHGGTVLLNARSGQWYAMNRTAGELWHEWNRTGDFDTAVDAMTRRFPHVRSEHVRADAEELAEALVERGLLLLHGSSAPRERRAPHERGPEAVGGTRPRWRHRAAGLVGLVAALCLLRLPFRLTTGAVTLLKRRWCRHSAAPEQAASAIVAVHRAAHRYPGRAACLELSLGTVLALALDRLSLDWCLGSAEDPYRFHAWVEVDGCPAVHPDDLERGPFHKVFAM